ncbi:MAG: mechanosensitive ion channel [Planctomycetaceae bacterium]
MTVSDVVAFAFQAVPQAQGESGDAVTDGFLDSLWADVKDRVTPEAVLGFAQTWGPKIVAALAILLIGRWVARFVTSVAVRAARRAGTDATLLSFLSNLIYMLLLTAVCIAALGQLGVNTTSLSAVLAAAGFAVGMAMQGSLGNLAAGAMLVMFKPFKVGDYVEVSGAGGTVTEIHIFHTVLLTPNNVRVIIPNGNITGNTIQNFSAEKRRRIDLVIGCGYNDDLPAVKQFLLETITSDSRVLQDPKPVVAVSELGDSSVNFVVRPWVASADFWATKFDLTERIKLGFDERGFTIPFPSRDVFLHNSDAA